MVDTATRPLPAPPGRERRVGGPRAAAARALIAVTAVTAVIAVVGAVAP